MVHLVAVLTVGVRIDPRDCTITGERHAVEHFGEHGPHLNIHSESEF